MGVAVVGMGVAMCPASALAETPFFEKTCANYSYRNAAFEEWQKDPHRPLNATLEATKITFLLDAGKFAKVTPLFLGVFSDRSAPSAASWKNDTGTLYLRLTTDNYKTATFNRLGLTVNVCVYKAPSDKSSKYSLVASKNPGESQPNTSLRLPGTAAIGEKS